MDADWLDPEILRWAIVVALGVLIVIAFWILAVIRKVIAKIVLLALMVLLGTSLWVQREGLSDCAQTCSCSLYGLDLQIPQDQAEQFC